LSGLFTGATYSVYGDTIGHIYEQPNAEVADSLLPALEKLLPLSARDKTGHLEHRSEQH
jgi:hypothetical protein